MKIALFEDTHISLIIVNPQVHLTVLLINTNKLISSIKMIPIINEQALERINKQIGSHLFPHQ